MARSFLITNDKEISLEIDDCATVMQENHGFANEIVAQTLEDGSKITDHVIVNPVQPEIVLFVSNKKKNIALYWILILKRIRDERKLCSLYTTHGVYKNVQIAEFSAPHIAPFKNQLEITIKFAQINFSRKTSGAPTLQQILSLKKESQVSSSERIAFSRYNPNIDNKKNTDYTYCAPEDLGEVQPEVVPEEFDWETESDVSVMPEATSTPTAIKEATVFQTFKATVQSAKEKYDYAKGKVDATKAYIGSAVQKLKAAIETVQQEIRYISNLPVGAQRFITTVGDQFLSFALRFDVLSNGWKMDVATGTKDLMLTGATVAPGFNLVKGLRLNYGYDAEGNLIPCNIKGLYMSPSLIPVPGFDKNAENTPTAFSIQNNNLCNCSLFYFQSSEGVKAYEYMQGFGIDKILNVDLEEMDYTFEVVP